MTINNNAWKINIGLEIHIQLNTKTKLFSNSSTKFGKKENTQISIIDLGFPGTMPSLNKEVISKAIKFGIAINGKISDIISFDRKHYFYPDLPKGYQITQKEYPIIKNGYVMLESGKKIFILYAHIEEDAGKLIHNKHNTSIDFNRAGIPLIEVVSSPNISNEKEAIEYLKYIHSLAKYLNISDANLEEGSFRCDVNISVKDKKSKTLGKKVEIKNINSFKFIKKSILYEIKRQINLLEKNQEILQETRSYDEKKNITFSLRSKENSEDYCFFKEPDIPSFLVSQKLIDKIKNSMPVLPNVIKNKLINKYSFNKDIANLISKDIKLFNFLEEVIKITNIPSKNIANYIITHIFYLLKKYKLLFNNDIISVKDFSFFISQEHEKKISSFTLKKILEDLIINKKDIDTIKNIYFTKKISDQEIQKKIHNILLLYNKEVLEFKNGKKKIFGYLMGKILKHINNQVHPSKIKNILLLLLKDK